MFSKHLQKWEFNFQHFLFSALIALELLMSFTFLGYIHIPPISITIAYIPVLIAGCLFGVTESTILGCIFGLASMYKATAYYIQSADKIFSPFLSSDPPGSVLLSVGSRMMFGFVIGVLFQFAKKQTKIRLWIGIVSALATKIHAFFVYLAIGILFPEAGLNFMDTFTFNHNDFLIICLCVAVVEIVWHIYHLKEIQHFFSYTSLPTDSPHIKRKVYESWGIFIFLIFCATVAIIYYFAQRMSYMLEMYGVHVSTFINHDMTHLQIQSLFAILSLNYIMILILFTLYRYMSYREYLGKLDGLTCVMGRKMFLSYCERLLNKNGSDSDAKGWFLFADVDNFKSINDTYGHPNGDSVLKTVAQTLSDMFSDSGVIGRMGGDEFAIILEKDLPLPELKEKLDLYFKTIADALPAPAKVTCSVGVCHFSYLQDFKTIYPETDMLLYKAKKQGRACYVIGEFTGDELVFLK